MQTLTKQFSGNFVGGKWIEITGDTVSIPADAAGHLHVMPGDSIGLTVPKTEEPTLGEKSHATAPAKQRGRRSQLYSSFSVA